MTADPFATWSDDYKDAQARLAAAQVRKLHEAEHRAARHLTETLAFYESRQWVSYGIEAETLDALINRLRQETETAAALRHQAETNLGRLLHSRRPYESPATISRRHNDMVRAAPSPDQPETLEPTPLETFISSNKPAPHMPAARRGKTRNRTI